MENSMMKRGIGAVVLAVIAALLLAYLLKGKSTERQEVVDMQLPGTPEMNIPSLSEAGDAVTSLASNTGETLSNVSSGAGTAIVASAAGAGAAVVGSVKAAGNKAAAIIVSSDNTNNTSNTKDTAGNGKNPGFSIRPSQSNEQRKVVDNTTAKKAKVAKKEKYKPRLIEEKKKKVAKKVKKVKKSPAKTVKKETKKPTKVAKKATPKAVAPKAASIATAAPAGKYSIQLLATSSSSRASKLSKVMKSEGYTTFITETNNNNKVLYRVRVGGYGNRNKAIQAQASMKRRYAKNFFVQNSLVVSK
jgi:cell division septation protein DedD